MQKTILNHGLTLKYFFLNTFYTPPPKSNDPEGCYQQAMRDFKELLRLEYIAELPTTRKKVKDTRRRVLYYVTRKGAQSIGRIRDYWRPKEIKSHNNTEHTSMVADICRSFLLNYHDHFKITYNKSVNRKKYDALLRDMKTGHDYLLEVDREYPYHQKRVITETCKKWGFNLAKFGLSKNTKVLIVYSCITFDTLMRPQEYTDQIRQNAKKNFDKLLLKAEGLSDKFRFMDFIDFYKLNKSVWYTPKGEKCKLINW